MATNTLNVIRSSSEKGARLSLRFKRGNMFRQNVKREGGSQNTTYAANSGARLITMDCWDK